MASGTNERDQRITIRSMYNTQKIKDEQDLSFAAVSGNYPEMAELLQSGVCVEAKHLKLQSWSSKTPLQVAAEAGHLQCVKLLIDYGAKLNATDEWGFTAVHLAAKNNHYQCLKMLLEAGADYSVPVRRPFSYMARKPNVGTTALHLAATYHNAKCIEELMQWGADCDTVDAKGRTSLYIAAEAGSKHCVLTLLRNIHGVTCVSLPSFDTSDSPLHHAVKNRMVECVKELVHLGADVNHINHRGLSPLHLLLLTRTERKHKSDMEILKYLVLDSHNIDINKTTKEGKTALDFAVTVHCDPETMKLLITYGADVNIKLKYLHLSPLQLEVMRPSGIDILRYLVNCMPQLPHLESLNVRSSSDIVHELGRILHEEELKNLLGETPMVIDQQVENMQVIPEYNVVNQPTSNPLQQPLLDKIYEVVIKKLEPMKDNHIRDEVHDAFQPQMSHDYYSFLRLKKQLWYERLASNPLTLQHCCRFSIRKCMGPSNLKHISKLPLPENIKSYLLFKRD